MKLVEMKRLANKYGHNVTFGDLIKQSGYTHKCPKCNGEGVTLEKYNAYPEGYLGSIFKDREVECDICGGHGWTKEEYEPIVEIIGYRVK